MSRMDHYSFLGLIISETVTAIAAGVGTISAALAAAIGVYLKAYKGSFKQQYDLAKLQIKDATRQIAEMKADRDFWKTEAEGLRSKLVERDRTIQERDRTIQERDRAIEEQTRVNRRLSSDVADLATSFLIRKGDAVSKRANSNV